jgi:hypothetical protein
MKAKKKKIESFKPEDLGLDFVSFLPSLLYQYQVRVGKKEKKTDNSEPTFGDYLCYRSTKETGWWESREC